MSIKSSSCTFFSHDCWNLVFSNIRFKDLKNSFCSSKEFQFLINDYARAVILNLGLESTNSELSFKRLSNIQNLLDEWTTSNIKSSIQDCLVSYIADSKEIQFSKYQLERAHISGVFTNDLITALKIYIINNLQNSECHLLEFKDNLFFSNKTFELIAYLTPVIFPKHLATKDLTQIFLKNSGSMLFALDQRKYEQLESLLNINFKKMIGNDHDHWVSLIVASLVNHDFESFKIIFASLKGYINSLNEPHKNAANCPLNTPIYFSLISCDDSLEAFCKSWEIFKGIVTRWTQKGIGNIAAVSNNIKLLTALKNISFNFNATYDLHANTPLHQVKTVEAAKILIEAGANINALNKDKETPVMIAKKQNNIELVQFLQ